MTKQDYILEVLAEECAEVQQAKSKMIRFGENNTDPVSGRTNINILFTELVDMLAMVDMLVCENERIDMLMRTELPVLKMDKIKKVNGYINRSIEAGVIKE